MVWICRQRTSSRISLRSTPCLRQRLLSSQRCVCQITWSEVSWEFCLCLPSCCRSIEIIDVQLYVGSGDSDSGCHVNVTSVLPTALFLQLTVCLLKTSLDHSHYIVSTTGISCTVCCINNLFFPLAPHVDLISSHSPGHQLLLVTQILFHGPHVGTEAGQVPLSVETCSRPGFTLPLGLPVTLRQASQR